LWLGVNNFSNIELRRVRQCFSNYKARLYLRYPSWTSPYILTVNSDFYVRHVISEKSISIAGRWFDVGEYPGALAVYEGFSLVSDSEQGADSGDRPKNSNNGETQSGPCNIPPRRFLWPLLRLGCGTILAFGGFVLILKYGYDYLRLGLLGILLFVAGGLLLVVPLGWWW